MTPGKATYARVGRIPMYSSPGGKAVPMPQKSAVSASAGVELKLEPKDRLIPCLQYVKPLDFPGDVV